ncbi:MAG: HNH endonuclease [Quinella sp. 1Q7]|nr:HNH endonuclease [Quinella sp. 1Q7]
MTDKERARYEDAKRTHAELMKVYPLTLDDLDGELWADIEGYVSRYQISTFGRVKSFFRGKARILKPFVDKDGYLQLTFGRGKKFKVHRIVALTFIPNPDGNPQINHLDGNKMNNHVSNLEWCTPIENNRHAVTMGLMKSGEDCLDAKLTNEQVAWCRRVHISGDREFGTNTLARKLGVSSSAIYLLLKGKTYKDVD